MPVFKPRNVEEILNDAINYMHFNTNLTDFNVGSVIRTILEAMAIEDSDQYSQISNVLNSFFLKNVFGQQLDDRSAEYDIFRRFAGPSVGEVVFLDTELQRSFLTITAQPGNTVIYVQDVSDFPLDNFIVKLGEGTAFEEKVQISSVNATNQSLQIDTTVASPFNEISYTHSAAETSIDEVDNSDRLVCLVSGSPARVIPMGITLRAKPTNITFPIEAVTKQTVVHENGDFKSPAIKVTTTTLGESSSVPEKRLNQIIGSPPFSGASVVNEGPIFGGRNTENDDELKDRIAEHVSGLSAGTKSAISDSSLTVVDPTTDKRVERVGLRNSTEEDILYVYIDDGSVLGIGETESFPSDSISEKFNSGETTLKLSTIEDFPKASTVNLQYMVINPNSLGGKPPFLTTYSSVDQLYLKNLSPIPYTDYSVGTSVLIVEVIDLNTELDRKYYTLDKYPLSEDEPLLFYSGKNFGKSTVLNRLRPGEDKNSSHDFILNKSNGQIEMLKGKSLPQGSVLFAAYEVFLGLIQLTQKVLDGDLRDSEAFPGIRSAGVQLLVRPTKKTPINITMNVTIDSSLTDMDTASFLSRQLTVAYINSLGIGSSVILSEIVDRVMSVTGVVNVKVTTPEEDQSILHNRAPFANIILVN